MDYFFSAVSNRELPRERLSLHGPSALSVQELLQVVLGRGVSGQPTAAIAQKLLARFGTLQTLSTASLEQLMEVKGIGMAKACQISACIELSRRLVQSELALRDVNQMIVAQSPSQIARVIQTKIADYKKEHCVVVSMDARARLISTDTVSVGILNANLVHPREILSAAVRRNAATIMLSHNHPSGDLEPSEEDITVTKRIVAAGHIFGIPLIDHIIVSRTSYLSFKERNLM